MNINSTTGVITWTPTSAQIGENEVTVKVYDKWESHNDTQSFVITVSEIVLISIEVLPSTMSLTVGSSKSITSVTANYDYGTSKNIALSACNYTSSDTGKVTVSANGLVTGVSLCTTAAIITVSYTEGGVTKTDTVSVTVSGGG